MTVKSCEKLEKSRVALTIEVGAEEFEAAVNKAYLKMRGKMNIPGFRPGKAPRKMIESMYGAEVFYEEAVNAILPDAYESAVDEQKLEVVGYPQVEIENVGKEGATFKCTVAVYPEVELGQYKGLEAVKAEVKVMAADVNARLKEMADRNSRLVVVERAVKKGDTANIDFEGFDQGVAFEGGKGEAFDLEIGSGSFVPGFEDQLIGMKAGEEKDIDITFPENYTPELAGKPVVFHVKVNEVKVKELPAIDDEFAKDVSEFDTLKELKADIKKKLNVITAVPCILGEVTFCSVGYVVCDIEVLRIPSEVDISRKTLCDLLSYNSGFEVFFVKRDLCRTVVLIRRYLSIDRDTGHLRGAYPSDRSCGRGGKHHCCHRENRDCCRDDFLHVFFLPFVFDFI